MQDVWPYALATAEMADMLGTATEGGAHTFRAGMSADTWRRMLIEMMDTGVFVPQALMYNGTSVNILHNCLKTGRTRPDHHETKSPSYLSLLSRKGGADASAVAKT